MITLITFLIILQATVNVPPLMNLSAENVTNVGAGYVWANTATGGLLGWFMLAVVFALVTGGVYLMQRQEPELGLLAGGVVTTVLSLFLLGISFTTSGATNTLVSSIAPFLFGAIGLVAFFMVAIRGVTEIY